MPTLNLGHVKGDTGAAAELQATATHIQWRPVGGTTWTNLVALADITGTDAAVTATNIAAATAAADAKSPPIDADEISLLDSAAAGALKRLSFGGLWTWIKAKIDLGQTWSGAHAFDSTTRPTSAGTGTPAANSLITRDDSGISTLLSGVRHWPTYYNLLRQAGTIAPQAAPLGELNLDTGNTAGTVSGGIYSTSVYTSPMLSMAGDSVALLNFNRRHRIAAEMAISGTLSGTAVAWFTCGGAHSTSSAAQPSVAGFGLKFDSSGVRAWVYGAGGYAEGAATAFASGVYHTVLLDYYSGTLSVTLDGAALATVSGGPSGYCASNFASSSLIAGAGATNERVRISLRFPKSLTTAS